MTVVLHISVVHPHDDERIFGRECRALANAGYDVSYLAPDDKPFDEIDGVRLRARPRRGPTTRFLDYREIVAHVRELGPHVVHVHDPELLTLLPRLRRAVPRLVYDMHEYVPQQVAAKHYIPARLRPAAARTVGVAQRALARWADGVVTVTEAQFEALGAKPTLRLALPNYPRAVRFADAAPIAELAADPRLKLIYTGSLTPDRGITMMLDVISRADDAVLYLAGSFGDPTYEAVVRTRIARELGDRVRLLGRITPDRIPAHLTSADVVWVPAMATSQYGKPTVTTKLFEGMAVGLAALVSDLPGRGDIVTATHCGLAVPPTVEGHLGGLRALAADRAALGPMGARGRAAVRERYSWEVVQKHLVDFYAKLCKGMPRGTPTR
jgi:glycosyltransferase involved in cell wall biosynthesis